MATSSKVMFRLEDLRAEAVAAIDKRIAEIRLGLTGQIPDGLRCQGREVLLRRAIENVVQNGVRHNNNGHKVSLRAETGDNGIVIRVRDFGPGVPEPMLAEIFRPFFRVQADRSRDSGGVGLGLAIAQRAIRLHHGELSARNAQPGLEVTFTLPH